MKLTKRALELWRDQGATNFQGRMAILPDEWRELCELALKGITVPEELRINAALLKTARKRLKSVDDAPIPCRCEGCEFARELVRLSSPEPQLLDSSKEKT